MCCQVRKVNFHLIYFSSLKCPFSCFPTFFLIIENLFFFIHHCLIFTLFFKYGHLWFIECIYNSVLKTVFNSISRDTQFLLATFSLLVYLILSCWKVDILDHILWQLWILIFFSPYYCFICLCSFLVICLN